MQLCQARSRLHRVRSAACLNLNHVASGIRLPCSIASSARSRTMAANPPACNSRSVARIAWSSRVQGCFLSCAYLRMSVEGFSMGAVLHRIQSRCFRLIPFAAADSGSNASLASIHAQTFPSCVRRARNANAILVRPEDAGPVISLIAPTGKPPLSKLSICAIPVVADFANSSRSRRENRRIAMLEITLDLLAYCGRGRHGGEGDIRLLFAYRFISDEMHVVNRLICGKVLVTAYGVNLHKLAILQYIIDTIFILC